MSRKGSSLQLVPSLVASSESMITLADALQTLACLFKPPPTARLDEGAEVISTPASMYWPSWTFGLASKDTPGLAAAINGPMKPPVTTTAVRASSQPRSL
ncbi:hypothetical protein NW754_006031 [Fusarium falciforme]|nr:hypothetical protein NW754_006031 [Fusarium falciforme]